MYVRGGGKKGGEEGDGDRVVIREEGMNIVSDPTEVTLPSNAGVTWHNCQTAAHEFCLNLEMLTGVGGSCFWW